jgi:hypothetical protein
MRSAQRVELRDPEKTFLYFGLALSISWRSVEANNATLTGRDVPGSGCVFTIDLRDIRSHIHFWGFCDSARTCRFQPRRRLGTRAN